MRSRLLVLLPLLAALFFLNGCGGHYGHYHGHHHHHRGGGAGLVVAGVVAGAVIVSASRPPPRERIYVERRVVYVNGPAPAPAAPLPRSSKDDVPTSNDLPAFDAQAARGALTNVDVTSCRDAGTPSVYGHAAVTFSPDGRITKVLVDEPRGLSVEAVSCVGSRLGTVTVPTFRGSAVTMGTTYRM